MLVTSIFFFSLNVFYPVEDKFDIFSNIQYVGKGLKAGLTFSYIYTHFHIEENFFWKTLWRKVKLLIMSNFAFLAQLAEGQRAIVMVLCPSCICPFVLACVHKLFIEKTSPQKLLTGFSPNFTGMFLRGFSFKFLHIIVFHEEFWLPWQPK